MILSSIVFTADSQPYLLGVELSCAVMARANTLIEFIGSCICIFNEFVNFDFMQDVRQHVCGVPFLLRADLILTSPPHVDSGFPFRFFCLFLDSFSFTWPSIFPSSRQNTSCDLT